MRDKIIPLLLSGLAFLLFFPLRASNYALAISIAYLLISAKKEHWMLLKYRLNTVSIAFIFFFIVCFVTAFVHEATIPAWKYTETRLALLLIPISFSLHLDILCKHENQRRIYGGFIAGAIVFTVVNVISAFFNSLHMTSNGWMFNAAVLDGKTFFQSINYGGNYFFSVHLSPNLHPTYASVYLIFCIVLLWNYFQTVGRQGYIYLLAITGWFLLHVFVLSSRAALLSIGVLCVLQVAMLATGKVFNHRFFYTIILIVAITALLILGNPRINLLFNWDEISQHNPRYFIWKAGYELLSRHSGFGLGFSGLKEALKNEYSQIGFEMGVIQEFNLHNQYFETLLTSGIIGLLSVLWVLHSFFRQAILNKNKVAIILLVLIAFNLLFESMLNRFSGVVFITFFFTLLAIEKNNEVNGYKQNENSV